MFLCVVHNKEGAKKIKQSHDRSNTPRGQFPRGGVQATPLGGGGVAMDSFSGLICRVLKAMADPKLPRISFCGLVLPQTTSSFPSVSVPLQQDRMGIASATTCITVCPITRRGSRWRGTSSSPTLAPQWAIDFGGGNPPSE